MVKHDFLYVLILSNIDILIIISWQGSDKAMIHRRSGEHRALKSIQINKLEDVLLGVCFLRGWWFSRKQQEPGHFRDELEIAKQLNHPCAKKNSSNQGCCFFLGLESCILLDTFAFDRYVVKLYEVFQTGECVHLVHGQVCWLESFNDSTSSFHRKGGEVFVSICSKVMELCSGGTLADMMVSSLLFRYVGALRGLPDCFMSLL